MPDQVASVRFDNPSELRAEGSIGAFLSAEFFNDDEFAAILGAQWVAAKVSFANTSDLNANGRMIYAGAVSFRNDSDLRAVLEGGNVVLIAATASFADDTDLLADLRRNPIGSVVMDTESDLRADFAAFIPVVREPGPTETWGTVNLARNPNLQYDDVGLQDWTAGAGITLTRTTLAASWDGKPYTGRAAVAPGGGAPDIVILSHAGLTQSGYGRRWVAAIQLRGELALISMWLRLVYDDTTTQDGIFVDYDPTDDWLRYATEVVEQDPAKILNRLELVIKIPQDAVDELILRLQAVQFEEALSGGATAYADGDQGPGHYWLGTPGFSMSVRETA